MSQSNNYSPSYKNAVSVVATEFFFNALPLIILVILFLYVNKPKSIIESPEWSLTAAIFFGQSIVKIAFATVNKKVEIHSQRVIMIIAGLLTLGLAPSIVIFVLLQLSGLQVSAQPPVSPANWLIIIQFIWLLMSVFSFLYLGIASETLDEK